MFKQNDKVFLRLPQEGSGKSRVLRPAAVLSVEPGHVAVQLEEPFPSLVSTEAFLHFEVKRKFMQQSALLLQEPSASRLELLFQLRGEPVSAEARQCFRVSAMAEEIKATIAGEARCDVVDVSATGFAFWGMRNYKIGQRVSSVMYYGGKAYTGEATVQSARRINATQTRYGVHCGRSTNGTLSNSLAGINLAIQGAQLRRLSGNA